MLNKQCDHLRLILQQRATQGCCRPHKEDVKLPSDNPLQQVFPKLFASGSLTAPQLSFSVVVTLSCKLLWYLQSCLWFHKFVKSISWCACGWSFTMCCLDLWVILTVMPEIGCFFRGSPKGKTSKCLRVLQLWWEVVVLYGQLVWCALYIPTLTYGHEIWVVTERIRLLKWDFSWERLDSALEIRWGAWTSRWKSWWLGYLITMLPWHHLLEVFRVHLSRRETLDGPMSLKRKYMPYAIYIWLIGIICAFCLRNALGIVYPVCPNWPTASENHSWTNWRCWMDR